jgi:hypothetical protein
MNWRHREPTLDELLSDNLIKLVMKADGVDADELAAMLCRVAAGRRDEGTISHFASYRRFRSELARAAC